MADISIKYKNSEISTLSGSGTKTIKTKGKYCEDDITVVYEQPQGSFETQEKTVTPTESIQEVIPDTGKNGLSKVTVEAIDSNYVGSGIERKSSADLTVSSAKIIVPAGYYAEQASKAVATGTSGTPTATKGGVSNNSISITPSVTNVAGYITSATKTGTPVTVSASELVSGNIELTPSETEQTDIDVTNYATASVAAVPSNYIGSAITKISGDNGYESSNPNNYLVDLTSNGYINACGHLNSINEIICIENDEDYPYLGVLISKDKFGNATAADVVEGKTFTSENGVKIPGTKVDPVIQASKTITENGVYTADNGYDAIQSIIVDIEEEEIAIEMTGTATNTNSSGVYSATVPNVEYEPNWFIYRINEGTDTNYDRCICVVYDGTDIFGYHYKNALTSYTGYTKSYSGTSLTIGGNSSSGYMHNGSTGYTLFYGAKDSYLQSLSGSSITTEAMGQNIYISGFSKSPDYFFLVLKNINNTNGVVVDIIFDGESLYGNCVYNDQMIEESFIHSYSYDIDNNILSIRATLHDEIYFDNPENYILYYGYNTRKQSDIITESNKTVTPTTEVQYVTPSAGYDALEQVTVNAIPNSYIIPSGNKALSSSVDSQSNIDVKNYATVSISAMSEINDSDLAFYGAEKNGNNIDITFVSNVDGALCESDGTSSTSYTVSTSGSDFGNATQAEVLSPKTFTSSNGVKISGTMPSRASGTTTFSSISKSGTNMVVASTIPTTGYGYYPASTVISTSVPASNFGNAAVGQVLKGTTFSSENGINQTGTLEFATIRYGTSAPSDSVGVNGDIYIKT